MGATVSQRRERTWGLIVWCDGAVENEPIIDSRSVFIHLDALMLPLFLTAMPTNPECSRGTGSKQRRRRRRRAMTAKSDDERWWHHGGHQGDERSEPSVTSWAKNRAWVIPAASHQQPIRELSLEMCINRWATNQRAVTSKHTKFVKKSDLKLGVNIWFRVYRHLLNNNINSSSRSFCASWTVCCVLDDLDTSSLTFHSCKFCIVFLPPLPAATMCSHSSHHSLKMRRFHAEVTWVDVIKLYRVIIWSCVYSLFCCFQEAKTKENNQCNLNISVVSDLVTGGNCMKYRDSLFCS